jgi:predicted PurR-regulated permease PerM
VSQHPLVVLVAVTCGYLLLGVDGALFAMPLVAVSYRVAVRLRDLPPTAGAASRAGP